MKRKTIEYGLLALLLWSPLPAASVEEWSVFVIELAVAVMAAAYILLDEKPSLNRHLPPVHRLQEGCQVGGHQVDHFQRQGLIPSS